ncbi:uncharacterized protein BDR25DRAFT_348549 [Lindgomyces ingoldianus]|uniref:Uncharacterized protein n=1 Tax=Lindgomyces ingoldianus TaxID=673940 RepID=A0ACB6RHN9_9PLEO|nr:uncharacterized protein BDR25DRAFT_348549 [Lindgomyces ingoldianus]KAF2478283.1 hypothetical protein BDR25DRAFT_348549 [Lindgomyces ingoldianus]
MPQPGLPFSLALPLRRGLLPSFVCVSSLVLALDDTAMDRYPLRDAIDGGQGHPNNPYLNHSLPSQSTVNDSPYIAYPGPGRPPPPPPDTPSSTPSIPRRPPPSVPLPNLRGFGSGSNDEGPNPSAPLSMGGIERALPTDSESLLDGESSISDDHTFVGSSSDHHGDAKLRYKKGLEVISYIKEKSHYTEDASQIIQRLQMAADQKLKRSYISGIPALDNYDTAPVIKVGIVFLPGVDRPTVTQLEQGMQSPVQMQVSFSYFDQESCYRNASRKAFYRKLSKVAIEHILTIPPDMLMGDYKPDQMTSEWRVNTAGHLLWDFEVRQDLRVISRDTTPQVLKHARARRDKMLPSFIPGQKTEALVISGREKRPAVNIDSDEVTLVQDLRYYQGQFDLESTLIEVDSTSMVSLLVNFQLIIQNRNAAQDLDETRKLLEAMMEDVRRLCTRSAILFRMSTRVKIITSKDIRYGVNNGREFTTLTTSKGIRKIINLSSAYYTSLDPSDKVQQLLRPRFLQMLVLLLSFLNDDDLQNIREFLEKTFHFRADRPSMELLFLKVIPFYSINSHVFLTSMVPAFEGWSPRKPDNQDHTYYWETFITRIAPLGYILPGTVDQLCRAQKSWIVQWPEKGFKDSLAFRNLQYGALDHMRTFNDIPPIERDHEGRNENTLLNAIFTDGKQYLIRVADYEGILCVRKGVYTAQEVDINGQRYDLIIEESTLNDATYQAVDHINEVIRRVNHWLTGFKGQALRRRGTIFKHVKVPGMARPDIEMLEELRVTGRLNRFRATLGNSDLAIAYKLDKRKITLEDTLAILARNNQEIQSVVDYYQSRLQSYGSAFSAETLRKITSTLNTVTAEIGMAEAIRQRIASDPAISDEPIVTLIEPPGGTFYSNPIWNDYKVGLTAGNMLTIEAKKSYVTGVYWDQEIVVTLHNDANQYIVVPLEYVDEKDRDDQVQDGDVAVLAGQYMILAEPVEEEGTDALIMSNYLKIVRVEQGTKISKRQQRRMQTIAMSRSVFV